MLDFLLKGGKSLSLLSDDVFVKVFEPLVQSILDGGLVVFRNSDLGANLFPELIEVCKVPNLHGSSDALAAHFNIVCICHFTLSSVSC